MTPILEHPAPTARRAPSRRPALTAALAAAALSAGAARAADMPLAARMAPTFTTVDPNTWIVTVSGNVQAIPQYPGAKAYTAVGYPSLDIRRAGEPKRFSAPDDGVSISLYDTPNFHIGPTARFVPGRSFKDNPEALLGFRRVRFAVEPGAFVEFWPLDNLRTRFELRHGVYGHHGFVGTVSVDLVQPVGQFVLSVGPRLNFGDDAFARKYFGVEPYEAALNGGLAAYRPDSFASLGVLGALTYTFDPRWAVTGYAGYSRIVGSSALSPLVQGRFGTPDQFTGGIKVDYSFTMPALF